MKAYLLLLIAGFMNSISPSNEDVTAQFTYTSKNCRYDVYQATAGGTIGCNTWNFVGTVTSSRNVTVTLYKGDNVVVRILKSGYGVCTGGKIKREDNLYLRPNATQSSRISRELHDWDCD